jgi:hypothetical protein
VIHRSIIEDGPVYRETGITRIHIDADHIVMHLVKNTFAMSETHIGNAAEFIEINCGPGSDKQHSKQNEKQDPLHEQKFDPCKGNPYSMRHD